jgi:hypothetical protein
MLEATVGSDQRDTQRIGLTAWMPLLLWCLIVTTFASFRRREMDELLDYGGIDAQVKFQAAAWAGLGLLAVWSLWSGRADLRLLRRGPLFWYVCFIGTALLSACYSPQPAYTAYRAFQHGIALVLVISLREHLRKVYVLVAVYIAVNWVLVVLGTMGINGGMPWIRSPWDGVMVSGGFEQVARFESAFGHPSVISILAGAAAAGLVYRARGRAWLLAGPVVGWLMLTALLTVSRTAIVGMLAGMAIAALGRRRLLPWVCLLGFSVPLCFLSCDLQDATLHYLTRGQSQSDLRSLTGRVPAYQEAVRRIAEYWPLGQGFQAGRFEALDATGENIGIAHAHNWLLESAFSLGLLGAVFTTLALISLALATVRLMWREDRSDRADSLSAWELAAMLAPLYAYCILDSGFVSAVGPVPMLFLVVASGVQTLSVDRAGAPRPAARRPQAQVQAQGKGEAVHARG